MAKTVEIVAIGSSICFILTFPEMRSWLKKWFRKIFFSFVLLFSIVSQAGVTVNLTNNSYVGMIQQPDYTNIFNGIFTKSFQITNSGTPGHPIVFKWASGAVHSSPTWNIQPALAAQSSSAIWGISSSNIIIDGAVIRCTNNGNTGLAYTNLNRGIYLVSSRDIEIKNCVITNLAADIVSTNAILNPLWDGVNDGGNANAHWLFKYPTAGAESIRIDGQNLTNNSIHNNFIDWTGNGILISNDHGFGGGNQIYSNIVSHCSWGIGYLQSVDATTNRNERIWANWCAYQTNYDGNPNDDSADNPNHQDGMIVSCNGNYGTCQNIGMRVYRNRLGPLVGSLSSSYIYQETIKDARNWIDLAICDNVFDAQGANEHPANGILCINGNAVTVINNTLVSHAVAGNDGPTLYRSVTNGVLTALVPNSANAQAFHWTNNLVVYCGFGVATFGSVQQVPKADYNGYFWPRNNVIGFMDSDVNGMHFGYVLSSGAVGQFPDWKALGCDTNGFITMSNAMLNADLSLTTNSPAANAGVNLTALYAALGIPAVDINGTARSAVNPWDMGAFVSGAAYTNNPPPPPPPPPSTNTYYQTNAINVLNITILK